MHDKNFIFCVGKYNVRGRRITGLLEHLEIVEFENSEGHFKEVFKEKMLQTDSRRPEEKNKSSATAGAEKLLLNL
jgi:hypothetical protein